MHSNSTKEKEVSKSNNTGEKLIEVEKTETGSVCSLLIFRRKKNKIPYKQNIYTYIKQFIFFMEKKNYFYIYILYFSIR